MHNHLKKIILISIILVSCSKEKEEGSLEKNELLMDVVINPKTGKKWMNRNLGVEDVPPYFDSNVEKIDLFQWGRSADGHEKRSSNTIPGPLIDEKSANSKFILSSRNWSKTANTDFWMGKTTKYNPCPDGFRVPTVDEWQEEIDSWNEKSINGGFFNSVLKLTFTGYRDNISGKIKGEYSGGFYWAVDNYSSDAHSLFINYDQAYLTQAIKSYGFAVRCINEP